jgi:folylpolyglutamate synthase
MLIKYKPFIRYIWRYYSSVMAAVSKSDYEKVVSTLNGLQTNAQVLAEIRKQSKNLSEVRFASVGVHLNRIGIDVDDLDDLNIIHVAGTKGKGSVCAMCESILRSHGLKTGFFSSPHLVEVRERIRINGVPLDKDSFVTYFWKCYDSLMKDKDNDSMPGFFAFLTLMAYQVFLSEKVDVAIIEVGIGGTYDSTNIIR